MTDADTIPSVVSLRGIYREQGQRDRALLTRCVADPSTDWRSLQVDAAIDRLDEVLSWLDACEAEEAYDWQCEEEDYQLGLALADSLRCDE